MELILNEMSIATHKDKYVANDAVKEFAKTVAEAKRNGFKNIRSYFATSQISVATNYTLESWLNDKDFISSKDYKDILYGMIIIPFIKEDDEVVEEAFISADYFYEDTPNGIAKTECVGLASAHLYDTLSISFSSQPAWHKNQLPLIIEENKVQKTVNVINVFSNECFTKADVTNKIEQIKTFDPIETQIEPTEKSFHLTGHHGQKEMQDLWDKLKHSKYVTEGMTIQWGGNTFFKNPTANGKLDIVHMQSDRRYVLQIQTTGRNTRETIEIAKILEDKYS